MTAEDQVDQAGERDDQSDTSRLESAGRPARPREAPARPAGGADSDDTTQADAGMAAGTGAVPAEGTPQPFGTRHDEADGKGNEEAPDGAG